MGNEPINVDKSALVKDLEKLKKFLALDKSLILNAISKGGKINLDALLNGESAKQQEKEEKEIKIDVNLPKPPKQRIPLSAYPYKPPPPTKMTLGKKNPRQVEAKPPEPEPSKPPESPEPPEPPEPPKVPKVPKVPKKARPPKEGHSDREKKIAMKQAWGVPDPEDWDATMSGKERLAYYPTTLLNPLRNLGGKMRYFFTSQFTKIFSSNSSLFSRILLGGAYVGSEIKTGFIKNILQGGALKVFPPIAGLIGKGITAPFKLFGLIMRAPFEIFKSFGDIPWKKIGKGLLSLGSAGAGMFLQGALAPFGILQTVLQGLGGMLSVGFVPIITSIVGLMLRLQPAISQVATWMQQLWTIFEMIFNGSGAGELLLTLLFTEIITQVMTWVNDLLRIVVEALPGIINIIVALVPSIFNALMTTLPVLLSAVKNVITGLLQAVLAILPSLIRTLLSMIPMIIDLLVASIPLLLGVIIDLIPMLIDVIVTNIPMIIDSIMSAIPMIVEAIAGALPVILEALMLATPLILDMIFTKALPLLIDGIVDALKTLATSVFKAIVDSFKNIGEKIKDAFTRTPQEVGVRIKNGIKNFFDTVKKSD